MNTGKSRISLTGAPGQQALTLEVGRISPALLESEIEKNESIQHFLSLNPPLIEVIDVEARNALLKTQKPVVKAKPEVRLAPPPPRRKSISDEEKEEHEQLRKDFEAKFREVEGELKKLADLVRESTRVDVGMDPPSVARSDETVTTSTNDVIPEAEKGLGDAPIQEEPERISEKEESIVAKAKERESLLKKEAEDKVAKQEEIKRLRAIQERAKIEGDVTPNAEAGAETISPEEAEAEEAAMDAVEGEEDPTAYKAPPGEIEKLQKEADAKYAESHDISQEEVKEKHLEGAAKPPSEIAQMQQKVNAQFYKDRASKTKRESEKKPFKVSPDASYKSIKLTQELTDIIKAPFLRKRSIINKSPNLSMLRQLKIFDKGKGIRELCEKRIRQIEAEIGRGESSMSSARKIASDIESVKNK